MRRLCMSPAVRISLRLTLFTISIWLGVEVVGVQPDPNQAVLDILKKGGLLIPIAFLGFYLVMKKTLHDLDPSAVFPERVKAALDSLVEGVVLINRQERIVLSNKAFDKHVGDFKASLVGQKVSSLNWTASNSQKRTKAFPWLQAMREGVSQAAVALTLQGAAGNARTFMVNGAPIIDDEGKTRGALATFDDVTPIEAQNTQLQKMLRALKKSRDEIRKQNQALQVLATQDLLTGCMNRRAFSNDLRWNTSGRNATSTNCRASWSISITSN